MSCDCLLANPVAHTMGEQSDVKTYYFQSPHHLVSLTFQPLSRVWSRYDEAVCVKPNCFWCFAEEHTSNLLNKNHTLILHPSLVPKAYVDIVCEDSLLPEHEK